MIIVEFLTKSDLDLDGTMNRSFIIFFRCLAAILVVLGALIHGFIEDISIFHGFVIHPSLIVIGLLVIANTSKLKTGHT